MELGSVIFWIVQVVITGVIGMLGYFIKRTLTQVENSITGLDKSLNARIDKLDKTVNDRIDDVEAKHNERIEKLETKMEQLPMVYTLRDDFIRTVSNFDKKLDRILEKLAEKS